MQKNPKLKKQIPNKYIKSKNRFLKINTNHNFEFYDHPCKSTLPQNFVFFVEYFVGLCGTKTAGTPKHTKKKTTQSSQSGYMRIVIKFYL